MERVNELKGKIEKERIKLDALLEKNELEGSYNQSLVLDSLIEEYISAIEQI